MSIDGVIGPSEGAGTVAPHARERNGFPAAARCDAAIRNLVRRELPAAVFRNRPARALWVVPLIAAIMTGSLTLVCGPLPWPAALIVALMVGHCYGSLMLLGHEIAHGATVRSRRLQDTLMGLTGLIFCVPPHLWRAWHHVSHHSHTNEPECDPDNFGTYERYRDTPTNRLLLRLAPGSGHWLSWLYLPTFFTVHSQGVLWWKSQRWRGLRYSRRRAAAGSMAMATFWVVVSCCAGPRGALLAVLIPMLVANALIMSYIATNHLLRPLTGPAGVLDTTMSVTTSGWLDRLHFHFSHHVEHHLFPAMPSCHYPLVRRILQLHSGGRYLAPDHWRALRLVFATPRLYDAEGRLVDPLRRRKTRLAAIDTVLRGWPTSRRSLVEDAR